MVGGIISYIESASSYHSNLETKKEEMESLAFL